MRIHRHLNLYGPEWLVDESGFSSRQGGEAIVITCQNIGMLPAHERIT